MRCYDGCPDAYLQSKIDSRDKARKRLENVGLTVTYFPLEQKWMVFKCNELISDFYNSVEEAAHAVLG